MMGGDAEDGRNAESALERARALLTGIAAADRFDLAEAALALGALETPDVDLDRYRHHLDHMAADVAAMSALLPDAVADSIAAQVTLLNEIMFDKYDYRGDTETYDDLQNANLIRVIDRRRGLPVALGILYIRTARAQGWSAVGINFPNHFLVRLEAGGERIIVDPFNRGVTPDAAALRALLQAALGEEAQLDPAHYAAVADRDILLRLQNNIKVRLLREGRSERALAVIEAMALFAPDEADLQRQRAILLGQMGRLGGAIEAARRFLDLAPSEPSAERHRMAAMIQDWRSRLN